MKIKGVNKSTVTVTTLIRKLRYEKSHLKRDNGGGYQGDGFCPLKLMTLCGDILNNSTSYGKDR